MNVITALGFLSALVGIPASTIALVIYYRDHHINKKIQKASVDRIPIRINRPITYKSFKKGISFIRDLLKEQRFEPDFIIGVHYGGMAIAAELGKQMYKPILKAEVQYHMSNNVPVCDTVIFLFDPTILTDKKVLVVDNSIRSGITLKKTIDEAHKHTNKVKSLVAYKKDESSLSHITPNYILFQSKKPLEDFIK